MHVKPFINEYITSLKKAKTFIELLPPIIALHAEVYHTSSNDVIKEILKDQYLVLLTSRNVPEKAKNLVIKIFDMSVPQLYEFIADLRIPKFNKIKLLFDMDRLYGIVKNRIF